ADRDIKQIGENDVVHHDLLVFIRFPNAFNYFLNAFKNITPKPRPGQQKNLNTFNYSAGGRRGETFSSVIRRVMGGAGAKKARKTTVLSFVRFRENVFFNPRPICGHKCYDGLTLTTWSVSYRIGEVI